jgi:hypothetical protein
LWIPPPRSLAGGGNNQAANGGSGKRTEEQKGTYKKASCDLFSRAWVKKGIDKDFVLLMANHSATIFKTLQNLNGSNDSTTKKWIKDYTDKEMKDFSTQNKRWMIKTANE